MVLSFNICEMFMELFSQMVFDKRSLTIFISAISITVAIALSWAHLLEELLKLSMCFARPPPLSAWKTTFIIFILGHVFVWVQLRRKKSDRWAGARVTGNFMSSLTLSAGNWNGATWKCSIHSGLLRHFSVPGTLLIQRK